ncbi:STAS/SEC14 domain-containing protein [Luteimonas composti]|uniref:STAS/SEC14 domain-containing protein n=1 Tax=Luteimonas composti TaxID=398257 RepID=A0ABT6MQ74_9GAMM|nr:STAS/SEC14 domain-containing protein [Luteimonas composti]MDH7452777.1 STAS/SEC14 domain-containing protein [Luteimonas composti]
MHDFLPTADDVIALVVRDEVASTDLEAIMDRLEARLQRHGQVHVYVETRAIDGIALAGLGAHVARAMPLLGQLKKFGRVAVVADQAWVRVGSRLESALLPFVSYRVFEPAQREDALAWVQQG